MIERLHKKVEKRNGLYEFGKTISSTSSSPTLKHQQKVLRIKNVGRIFHIQCKRGESIIKQRTLHYAYNRQAIKDC